MNKTHAGNTKSVIRAGRGVMLAALLLAAAGPRFANAQTPAFTHASGSPYPGAADKYSVALGDVNGNGHLDIVTVNRDADTFSILLNDGAGNFSESPHSPAPAGCSLSENNLASRHHRVSLADISGNGYPDIVSAGSWGLIVLLNNGEGEFSPAPGSPFNTGLNHNSSQPVRNPVVADMNNNGRPDVVGWTYGLSEILGEPSGYQGGYLVVFLNDGQGGFAQSIVSLHLLFPEVFPGLVSNFQDLKIETTDLNGDGVPDIVVTGRDFGGGLSYPVLVLPGDGMGGLIQGWSTMLGYPWPLHMTTGDINKNGATDIIVSTRIRSLEYGDSRDPDMFRVLINDGTGGHFTLNTDTQSNKSYALLAGDVNGDGVADVLSVDLDLWGLRVWQGGPGGLALQGTTVLSPLSWVFGMALGDINLNGKPDLVLSYQDSGSQWKIGVLLNTTANDFAPLIGPPNTAGGRVNEPFSFAIPASGTAPITFAANPLPSGLSLTGDTISGTPTQVGQTAVTLTASNAAGSDTKTLTITITDPANPNSPPQITSGPFATPNPVGADKPVSFSVTASDPDGDPLSYLWNFGDGTVSTEASPTHSYATNGVFAVGLTVMDGKGGSAIGGVTMTVSDLKPGDLNGDGVVNVDDVTLVTSHWGMTSDNPNWDPRADANGDGVVNQADLDIVIENFGTEYE